MRFSKTRFLILILLALTPSTGICTTDKCNSLFTRTEVVESNISNKSSEHIFWIEETTPESNYYFKAELGLNGRLSITAKLKALELGLRSSLSGKRLYEQMMEYFGTSNIKVVEGSWFSGKNLDSFRNGLRNGQFKEEAAAQTWSGEMAGRYGFTKVESISVDTSSGLPIVFLDFVRP